MKSVMRTAVLILLGLSALILGKCPEKVKEISFKEMDYNYPESTFSYEGHEVTYIDVGTGKPVVFLHGQASDITNFETVYPVIGEKYRVLALDYPGFGKSEKHEIKYSEQFLIGVIDELYRETGIEQATIVGHSYGGCVAMIYGLARPDNVDAMVLISPAGIQVFPDQVKQSLRASFTVETILNTTVEQAIDNYQRLGAEWTPELERYALRRAGLLANGEDYKGYAHAMVQAMEIMLRTTVRKRIGETKISTLIIWGRQDALVPHFISAEAVKYIPHAKLETLENCGHFPMFECVDKFNQILIDFLGEKI